MTSLSESYSDRNGSEGLSGCSWWVLIISQTCLMKDSGQFSFFKTVVAICGPFSYCSFMLLPPMSCKIMAVKVNSCSSGLTGKFCFAMSKTLLVCATPKSFFSKYGVANLNSLSVSILPHPCDLYIRLVGYLAVRSLFRGILFCRYFNVRFLFLATISSHFNT